MQKHKAITYAINGVLYLNEKQHHKFLQKNNHFCDHMLHQIQKNLNLTIHKIHQCEELVDHVETKPSYQTCEHITNNICE